MLPGVLGCIAGDDTVLVVTRSQDVASQVGTHLLSLADPASRSLDALICVSFIVFGATGGPWAQVVVGGERS